MRKRIISTLMALCMALTLLPVQVLAANYAMGEDAGVSARALAGTAGTEIDFLPWCIPQIKNVACDLK